MSFIDTHRDRFGVEPIRRTLGIARSTYYAPETRLPSRRAVEDAVLLAQIRTVHGQNYDAYGSRRVWHAWAELRRLWVAAGSEGAAPPGRAGAALPGSS